MGVAKCIYCGRYFNPALGAGDHVLPSAIFGEFQGDSRFRGCCSTCNNHFGTLEQIVAQAGPEGYLRGIVLGKNPGRRKAAGIQQRGAKNSKAPVHLILRNERYELIKIQPGNFRSAEPVDHFRILDGDGNEYFVQLYPNITRERLQEAIDSLGISDIREVAFDCDSSHYTYYKKLSKELFSSMTNWRNEPGTEPGNRTLPGRVKFTFSTDYFRAIAKMAFHYYLVHCRRGYAGDEMQFKAIRSFIKCGGDYEQFFDQPGPRFHMPFGENTFVPTKWCHLLWAYETENQVLVEMYLFLGPELVPPPHRIQLCKLSSELVLPGGAWGHRFRYFSQAKGRYLGCVEPLDVGRLA